MSVRGKLKLCGLSLSLDTLNFEKECGRPGSIMITSPCLGLKSPTYLLTRQNYSQGIRNWLGVELICFER